VKRRDQACVELEQRRVLRSLTRLNLKRLAGKSSTADLGKRASAKPVDQPLEFSHCAACLVISQTMRPGLAPARNVNVDPCDRLPRRLSVISVKQAWIEIDEQPRPCGGRVCPCWDWQFRTGYRPYRAVFSTIEKNMVKGDTGFVCWARISGLNASIRQVTLIVLAENR